MADNLIKNLNYIVLSTEGVTSIVFPGIVSILKDKGYELDIYINVAYGHVIPQIAWNVQENIKHLFDENKLQLFKANIHIEGIDNIED